MAKVETDTNDTPHTGDPARPVKTLGTSRARTLQSRPAAPSAIPLPISPAIPVEQGLTGGTAERFNGHRQQFIKDLRLSVGSACGDMGNGMLLAQVAR